MCFGRKCGVYTLFVYIRLKYYYEFLGGLWIDKNLVLDLDLELGLDHLESIYYGEDLYEIN